MIDNPAQLRGDVADALPARLAILLETAPHHVVEQRIGRLERGDRRWLAAHDCRNHSDRAGALECLPSREHLVEHRAEGEDVGTVIADVALELLGRHVLHGAADAARRRRARQPSRCQRTFDCRRQRGVDRRHPDGRPCGHAEVEQLDVGRARRPAAPHQHHVARLQIAMDDAGAVRAVERLRDLNRDRERFVDRQPRRSVSVSPSRYSRTR